MRTPDEYVDLAEQELRRSESAAPVDSLPFAVRAVAAAVLALVTQNTVQPSE